MKSAEKITLPGKLCKIVEFLKVDKSEFYGTNSKSSIISIKKSEGKIERITRVELKLHKIIQSLIGLSYIDFLTEVFYDDKKLKCVTQNPHCIDNYFQFTQTIEILQKSDNELSIKRKHTVTNKLMNYPLCENIGKKIEESYYNDCDVCLKNIYDESQKLN